MSFFSLTVFNVLVSGCAVSSFWHDAKVKAANAMTANTFFMMVLFKLVVRCC